MSEEIQKLLRFMIKQGLKSENGQQCLWCKGKYTKLRTHLLRMIIKPAWCPNCDLGVDTSSDLAAKNKKPCDQNSMHKVVIRQISPQEIATLRKLYVEAASKTGLDHLTDIRKLPLYKTTYNALLPPKKCTIEFITNH